MAKDKSRLLDQTGPFTDWKEASERFEQLSQTWLDESLESMPHANLLLAKRMGFFLVRLNKTVDARRSKHR